MLANSAILSSSILSLQAHERALGSLMYSPRTLSQLLSHALVSLVGLIGSWAKT